MVAHLESSSCVSGLTRSQIDRYVATADRHNIITNPDRMIGYGDQRPVDPPKWIATPAAFNPATGAYECYFCPRRLFGTIQALNKHLASPKHSGPDIKQYRCPQRDCQIKFATLSRLCQHMEAGSCGVLRFNKHITDAMDQLINGTRRLGL